MAKKIKNNSPIVLSDRYSTEEYMIEHIAKKYFNLENDSNYRVSTFGYINELFATGTNMTAYSMAVLFSEIFPNTAMLPETIYTYASLAQISGITSTPSSIPIVLTMTEKDIIGDDLTISEGKYVIPKESVIKIENFKFALDYNITLAFKKINGEFIYSASYNLEDKNNLANLVNPFIPLTKFRDSDGEWKISLFPIIRQVQRSIIFKTVSSPNALENITHTFDFKDQLADFNIYYREPNKDEFVYVEKYLDGAIVEIGNKFCFYRITEENKLEIIFQSRAGYFRPEFNSELKVEILSCVGEKANFTYKGQNISITYPDEEEDKRYIRTNISILGNSIGGKDKLSQDKLKELVCNSFSLRKTIVMEKDLYDYYNRFLESKDTSIVRFIKYRDDVFRRMYLAYLLLKKDDVIVPTNTLDAEINNSDFDYTYTNIGIIKSGGCWELENGLLKYHKTVPSTLDDNKYYYSNPYLLVLSKKPSVVTTLLDKYNVNRGLDYIYINKNSFVQFINDRINISRNPDVSPNIKLSIDLIPNSKVQVPEYADVANDGSITTDKGYMKVYLGIYDKKENSDLIGYLPMTMTKYIKNEKSEDISTFRFEATLQNTNNISNTEIILNNSLILPNGTNTESEVRLQYDNLRFRIFVAIKDSIPYTRDLSQGVVIPNTHSIVNVYENFKQDDVFLLQNVRDVLPIEYASTYNSGTTSWTYRLVKMPMIKYSFLKDDNWHNDVNEIILSKQDMLNRSRGTIVENYSVAMKFFNTYGPSKYYYVGNSNGRLDRVNITLKLKISLNRNNSVNKELLIKSINDYVLNINTSKMESFYISRLMDWLHDEYVDIRKIEFLGINNYDTLKQSIESLELDDSSVIEAGYVPEFINFDLKKDINGNIKPDISIIFE